MGLPSSGRDGNTILLFGPQALSFQEDSFHQLRSTILNDSEHSWILDVVAQLPSYMKAFSEKFPKLQASSAVQLLENLNDWFKTGKIPTATKSLPNTLLSPLVVLTQLTQYSQYLQLTQIEPGNGQDIYASHSRLTETVGFCTGLLSALAVSCANNRAQFRQYGAVTVRLAALVGAVVDSQDSLGQYGESKSFATAWNSQDAKKEMSRIMQQFPEAYVSVKYDENRATVTTAASSASSFQQQLRAVGVIATEVRLRGRFHCNCYEDIIKPLIAFCDATPELQLPDASRVVLPVHALTGGDFISEGKLHHIALREILVDQSQWYQTFGAVYESRLTGKDSLLVSFGLDKCVPPSFMRGSGPQLVHMMNLDEARARLSLEAEKPSPAPSLPDGVSENDIAVIGVACKTAGADDLEEFWKINREGKSQHVEVPESRVSFETHWRDLDPKRKWYGNFIRDPDAFDHKFFKKSPREVTSQDPQQRYMMQIAYQAVEQSGYFNSPNANRHVGCYVGMCATDYEYNVACHPANAFSATGNLRSFVAGKISHWFGWTGPGLTIDTACSASAVAIHQACKAILGGECSAALAGGVTVITNPLWFQNLAGASFLSPTGACKPFDAKADGYCRGEGIAAVFLKKMSEAVADGDPIIGNIKATAVYQNENCTPIFVPNSLSLSGLFGDVVKKSGLDAKDVSVVECHGTGTPVGDPAEYESVLKVFGGSIRSNPMPIGSVKGLVGHTEAASGVIALVKMLLMIQEGQVPPQASFTTMSPHIKAKPSDMLEVVTQLKPWEAPSRAALINNYGASGSNASMIIAQAHQHDAAGATPIHEAGNKQPFWLTGYDDRALKEYASRLKSFITSKSFFAKNIDLANLSFNVYRQSNRGLDKGLMFSCTSVSELEEKLTDAINGDKSLVVAAQKVARPVILCFGGQIATFVGLDKKIFESVALLRKHLDSCHTLLKSNGLSGIYPEIFQKTPIEDTVKLQTCLFALQYSCARSWIDSGVHVTAIVGHSFGELTALCISGVLSLKDAIKMIAARAKLVRDYWGADRGSMMVAEGDLPEINKLLAEANQACDNAPAASVACYNGPRSFTLAGSTKSIDAVADRVASYTGIRVKRLTVSNAFHSTLVEPLLGDLERLGQGLTFNDPVIQWERATENPPMEKISAKFFASHMRDPVYANSAFQRLAQQYPSAIWLEAGSNSTITNMASKALGAPSGSHFQSVNLNVDSALQNLSDTTVGLWKQGLNVAYWAHHGSQTYEYSLLLLPPYQFEKNKHWLEMKKPQKLIAEPAAPKEEAKEEELPKGLFTFMGYQDKKNRSARFRINTMIKKYEEFISGHLIAQTAPICPATLEVDMAVEALLSLNPEVATSKLQPEIHSVDNYAPICIDASRTVWLDFDVNDSEPHCWDFKFVSTGSKGASSTLHVSGKIVLRSVEDAQAQVQFGRYERLVAYSRCLSVLNGIDADDIIQGRNIYKAFADVVDYGEQYRGLQKLVGKGNESAGRINKAYNAETWLDTHLSDCFSQVGGIWVNCMTDRSTADMYIANGFESWIRSPKLDSQYQRPDVWDVFAYHNNASDKAYTTDIFIFDSTNGKLLEVILGINYAKVPKTSMSKMLSRLTVLGEQRSASSAINPPAAAKGNASAPAAAAAAPATKAPKPKKTPKPKKKKKVVTSSSGPDVTGEVLAILVELSGLEASDIKPETQLADIGIDSLMGMEMAHELEGKFKCSIPEEDLVEVATYGDLIKCMEKATGGGAGGETVVEVTDDEASSEEDDDEDDSSPGTQSPVSLADSMTTVESTTKLNIASYIADFLGVDEGDVSPDTLLRDLGVDSLLSTELRHDIGSKTDVHIPEDVALEELSVKELDAKVNGEPAAAKPAAAAAVPAPQKEAAPQVAASASTAVQSTSDGELNLASSTVLEAFGESKMLTDQFIKDYRCADYMDIVNPKQTQLCVALTLEAFEQLGCSIKNAKAGDKLARIQHEPQHGRLAEYLYDRLEKDARLIDIDGDTITRTAITCPTKSSKDIVDKLVKDYPDHLFANKLTYYCGTRLADVLTGKSDGIKLIFGTTEGRELVAGLYGDSLLNKLSYKQMEDFVKRLVSKLPKDGGPFKILEMGAGTGGTTKYLAPLLASLNVPVEYTFTDLAPSFVAQARKTFKQYPFMKFRAHDIEKEPAEDLIGTQHLIVASNAVHATHSLTESTKNIRKALRPDGFLMMLEMTETLYWIDVIFGLLEGWWLFDDGRRHAISHQDRWERDLQSVGYGHVDYTDGHRPENNIQRIIIAMASGPKLARLPIPQKPVQSQLTDTSSRQLAVTEYVKKNVQDFVAPVVSGTATTPGEDEQCVLVTGATGSLGSHLIEHFAKQSNVKSVICINRSASGSVPDTRQQQAMTSRGIELSESILSKLQVLETDTTKPLLGLPKDVYDGLVEKTTHILHNAWPMSGKRPVKGFELQFQVMRNLINFARDISCRRTKGTKVGFQFISSIATVGHYPLWSENPNVPEERMKIESILPNGYGDAKYVCELMLDETLHKYPDQFRTMAVRLGQVAGSKTSGYWNPMEHLSFLVKSSQTLKALPNFEGLLSWTPVNDVAATLGELLVQNNTPYPIYHIDNPVRQAWQDMIPVLADALNVPRKNVVDFEEWVRRVRNFPGSVEADNPAFKLIEFLDGNFLRMSCGGLLLGTEKAREHSKTLANLGPVSDDVARKYVQAWRDMGFLH